jgi:hypothetical protein
MFVLRMCEDLRRQKCAIFPNDHLDGLYTQARHLDRHQDKGPSRRTFNNVRQVEKNKRHLENKEIRAGRTTIAKSARRAGCSAKE